MQMDNEATDSHPTTIANDISSSLTSISLGNHTLLSGRVTRHFVVPPKGCSYLEIELKD